MAHESYGSGSYNSSSKSKSKSKSMSGDSYDSTDMKSTTMDRKAYYRPMDSYRKGHEY